jgi:hypothetical protein
LSAPSKVLFVGADSLLTTSFWGGSCFLVGGAAGPAPKSVGPAPKSDAALGLVVKDVGAVSEEQAHVQVNVQVIKGDTQKADGAVVLDHLWVYAFLCGYGQENHRPQHLWALGLAPHCSVGSLSNSSPPDGWECTASGLSTLALFRAFGLSPWRQQVLRGFFAWRRRNIRITKGCSPGQMVRQSFITREGLGRVHFVWTLRGKASYKAQWDFVQSNPDSLATVKAGGDAWFEWLEGLAPFFWN